MKRITVVVQGGVVQNVVDIPEGVEVAVRDYDTDGSPPEELQGPDEDGNLYHEGVFTHALIKQGAK